MVLEQDGQKPDDKMLIKQQASDNKGYLLHDQVYPSHVSDNDLVFDEDSDSSEDYASQEDDEKDESELVMGNGAHYQDEEVKGLGAPGSGCNFFTSQKLFPQQIS